MSKPGAWRPTEHVASGAAKPVVDSNDPESVRRAIGHIPGAWDLHQRLLTHGWDTYDDAKNVARFMSMFVIDILEATKTAS